MSERLTKKTNSGELTTIGMPNAVACYWKLKKYEDIEEELGIDLIKLLKVVDDGVLYTKDKEVSLSQGIRTVYMTLNLNQKCITRIIIGDYCECEIENY